MTTPATVVTLPRSHPAFQHLADFPPSQLPQVVRPVPWQGEQTAARSCDLRIRTKPATPATARSVRIPRVKMALRSFGAGPGAKTRLEAVAAPGIWISLEQPGQAIRRPRSSSSPSRSSRHDGQVKRIMIRKSSPGAPRVSRETGHK